MDRMLDKLPTSEAELVRSIVQRRVGVDHDLARLRLRNIASKYSERLKRARLSAHRGEGSGELALLEERLAVLRFAAEVLESDFQEPGDATSAD